MNYECRWLSPDFDEEPGLSRAFDSYPIEKSFLAEAPGVIVATSADTFTASFV